MTGRILGPLPGVHAYTQSTTWASDRWRYIGSIFDSFASVPSAEPVSSVRRVVVTVGTTESYGFHRLFERLVQILPSGVETLWQTGATDVSELPIEAQPKLPASVLSTALRDADVVVAHAGTGSALAALEAGKYPVLVPRRGHRKEHIDDHQLDTATDLQRRGLALHREVDDLQLDDLYAAAQRRVQVTAELSPVRLVGWS
jgi:UDP-N-acetylglucosamine transferase subunit ALG13